MQARKSKAPGAVTRCAATEPTISTVHREYGGLSSGLGKRQRLGASASQDHQHVVPRIRYSKVVSPDEPHRYVAISVGWPNNKAAAGYPPDPVVHHFDLVSFFNAIAFGLEHHVGLFAGDHGIAGLGGCQLEHSPAAHKLFSPIEHVRLIVVVMVVMMRVFSMLGLLVLLVARARGTRFRARVFVVFVVGRCLLIGFVIISRASKRFAADSS